VLKAPVEVLTAFDVVAMARNCRSTGGYGHGAIRDKNDRGSRLDMKRFLRTWTSPLRLLCRLAARPGRAVRQGSA